MSTAEMHSNKHTCNNARGNAQEGCTHNRSEQGSRHHMSAWSCMDCAGERKIIMHHYPLKKRSESGTSGAKQRDE